MVCSERCFQQRCHSTLLVILMLIHLKTCYMYDLWLNILSRRKVLMLTNYISTKLGYLLAMGTGQFTILSISVDQARQYC